MWTVSASDIIQPLSLHPTPSPSVHLTHQQFHCGQVAHICLQIVQGMLQHFPNMRRKWRLGICTNHELRYISRDRVLRRMWDTPTGGTSLRLEVAALWIQTVRNILGWLRPPCSRLHHKVPSRVKCQRFLLRWDSSEMGMVTRASARPAYAGFYR